METVLRSLILKRFRSIPTETVQFANPTFLVGRNGSGKSNFCDALDFLAEAMSSSLQSVAGMRTYAINPARLRESQDTNGRIGLKADGSNTASVLQDIGRNSRDD